MSTTELITMILRLATALRQVVNCNTRWISVSPEWLKYISPAQMVELCDHFKVQPNPSMGGYDVYIEIEGVKFYADTQPNWDKPSESRPDYLATLRAQVEQQETEPAKP